MDDNGCLNKLRDAFGKLYHRSSRILSHSLHHVVSMKVITRTGKDWDRNMHIPYLGCDIRNSSLSLSNKGK